MSDPDSPIQPESAIAEDPASTPELTPQHAAPEYSGATDPLISEPTAPEIVPTHVPSAPAEPEPRIVYRPAPMPPKPRGNRGVGSLLAVLSGVLYALLFAIAVVIIFYSFTGRLALDFVGQPNFLVPVFYFVLGSVLLVLILNRAKWWTYVVGSIFVGLFVYFGTIGTLLLGGGIVLMTPEEAASAFAKALRNPIVIAAALIAREVALWAGAAISARGRRIRSENLAAMAAFDHDAAEHRVGYGSPSGTALAEAVTALRY